MPTPNHELPEPEKPSLKPSPSPPAVVKPGDKPELPKVGELPKVVPLEERETLTVEEVLLLLDVIVKSNTSDSTAHSKVMAALKELLGKLEVADKKDKKDK